MLCTIIGNLGSGKTLLATILAYYSNLPIISNYSIEFPNKQIEEFNLNKFIRAEYSNCVIVMDEAYTYLESRISGSELNRIMSYILFQSRKKSVQMYITAQLLSSLDKRYRELSDMFIVANRIGVNFQYFVLVGNQQSNFILKYENVLPFFDMYNTNEVILSTDKKILFDTQESADKLKEIEKYADEITEFYKERKIKAITKNLVDLYATTNNVPKFLTKDIHSVIRMRENDKKREKKNAK